MKNIKIKPIKIQTQASIKKDSQQEIGQHAQKLVDVVGKVTNLAVPRSESGNNRNSNTKQRNNQGKNKDLVIDTVGGLEKELSEEDIKKIIKSSKGNTAGMLLDYIGNNVGDLTLDRSFFDRGGKLEDFVINPLKIKVPEPEPGFDTATVTIITRCGVTNSKEFKYLGVCTTSPPPPPDEIITIEEDVVDAYDDCLEEIDRLFCEQEEKPPEYGNAELPGEQPEHDFLLDNGKVALGANINPSYNLSGSGFYSIEIVSYKEGEGFEILTRTPPTFFSGEMSNIRTGVDTFMNREVDYIEVTLTLYDTNRELTDTIKEKFLFDKKLVPKIVKDEDVKKLSKDNDLSDSHKETYITIDSTVDINKNYNNIQEVGLLPIDPLRDAYGAFWILNSQQTKYIYADREDILPSVGVSELIGTKKYHYQEKILFESEQDINFATEKSAIDVVYDYIKPYTKKEFDSSERTFSSRILDVKTEYNFYYKEYEDVHFDFSNNREYLLPNMYYLLLKDQIIKTGKTETKDDDIIVDPDIDNLISLVPNNTTSTRLDKINTFLTERTNPSRIPTSNTLGRLTSITSRSLFPVSSRISSSGRVSSIKNNSRTSRTAIPMINGDYYEYFIDKYKTSTIENDLSLIQRAKNIVVPYAFLPKIEEYSKMNQLFPMFADIKFDTDPKDYLSRRLKYNGLGDWFLLKYVNSFSNNDNTVKQMTFLKQQEDGQFFEQTNRYIDITNILGAISVMAKPEDMFVFLGDYKEYQKITPSGNNLQVQKSKFIKELMELVKDKGRKYTEILSGKKCYKEAVFYRIAKFGTDKENPIQNIWIPNDPDKNYLRYIDTQVVYEKGYTYRIYSYDITIANEYEIKTTNPSRTNNVPSSPASSPTPTYEEGANVNNRDLPSGNSFVRTPAVPGVGGVPIRQFTNIAIVNRPPKSMATKQVDHIQFVDNFNEGSSLSRNLVQEIFENPMVEKMSDSSLKELSQKSNLKKKIKKFQNR